MEEPKENSESLEGVVEKTIKTDKKGWRSRVRNSVDWVKEKYWDFAIFNGELLVAEGVSSVTGAAAGEMLSNSTESDLLITGGTILADSAGCVATYGFMDYLKNRKTYAENKKAFVGHMGKFGMAYLGSSAISVIIKVGLTYYLNKEGYSGGEAALLAKIPSSGVYLVLMNVLGYRMGLIGNKEEEPKKTL
ncbi:hypothetical protein GOV03_01195 [Candidatus Woesearchaeota archaeon]|nr:hypothetical protein [Candidatus Woesearchaeota archaeon]